MALTYNAAKTAWWQQPEADRDQEWPVVEAVILFSMVLGVSKITKENVNDVLARIRFYEKLNGGFLTSNGHDCNVPASIVRSLIGLTTNVRQETWASYSRRIVKNWLAEETRNTTEEV